MDDFEVYKEKVDRIEALLEAFTKGDYRFNRNVHIEDGTEFRTTSDTVVGLYGVEPTAQASKISDPSGGSTVDDEARTAINSIIDALEGIGISST